MCFCKLCLHAIKEVTNHFPTDLFSVLKNLPSNITTYNEKTAYRESKDTGPRASWP